MQPGNFYKNSLGRSIASRNQLVGKVVLLIGKDTPLLKTLVMQLAQKGANIALFYRKQSTEALQTLRQQVEALGQRLLLVSEKELLPELGRTNPANHLIKQITLVLGPLDIFIDLSATQENILLSPQNETSEEETIRSSWKMRQAIFAELAEAS